MSISKKLLTPFISFVFLFSGLQLQATEETSQDDFNRFYKLYYSISTGQERIIEVIYVHELVPIRDIYTWPGVSTGKDTKGEDIKGFQLYYDKENIANTNLEKYSTQEAVSISQIIKNLNIKDDEVKNKLNKVVTQREMMRGHKVISTTRDWDTVYSTNYVPPPTTTETTTTKPQLQPTESTTRQSTTEPLKDKNQGRNKGITIPGPLKIIGIILLVGGTIAAVGLLLKKLSKNKKKKKIGEK